MTYFQRTVLGILTLLMALIFLVGCKHQQTTQSHHLDVVTSLNFYGETARAVLGRHGQVTSLINRSNVDPHDFNPTIRDAKQISRANVIIDNGIGYDSWMKSLVQDATHAQTVDIATRLLHFHREDNPHLWYRPQTMITLANHLARQFSQKDPAHQQFYYQNAKRYVASLQPLQREINYLKQHRCCRRVDVSEPVFDYSLHAMGYHVNDSDYARAIEDGADPSPEAIRHVQNDFKRHRVAFFVQNTQASDTIVSNLVKLAHRCRIPVVKVTETMPSHLTYRQWMLKQYREVAQAQKEGNR